MIQITDLSKFYGQKQVLQNLNVELLPGNVYGIVGANGAGKTTLFRCIAGLEEHDGTIEANVHPLKDHLGFLPTNPIFMSHITGWEYLKLMCVARGIKTDDFEAQNIFDLPLKQYAETYSTGMKKKLALMGILLQQNEVFILDEPFNGVDIQSNMLISAIIKKLKTAQKTVLIASHIFSTLRENCDAIHLLEQGTFARHIEPADFGALETEITSFLVGETLDKLEINKSGS